MWLNAGQRAHDHQAHEGERITLAESDTSREYWVHKGYYVPFYPASEEALGKAEQMRLLDDTATELARRFFRQAEIGINVRFNAVQIDILKENYTQEKDPAYKRAKGALLIGACVNRMERIAHALIAVKSGADIRDYRVQENDVETLKDQFNAYGNMLMGADPACPNLFAHVRLRNGVEDRDGILEEMISEVIKVSDTRTLSMLNQGRAMKIGQAMESMDRTRDAIKSIFDTSWPHKDSDQMARNMARALIPHVNDLTQMSRGRVGVKTSDAENYTEAYAMQNATLSRFRETIRAFHDQCQNTRDEALDKVIQGEPNHNAGASAIARQNAQLVRHMQQLDRALDLIEEGVEMIMEMSEIRMSHQSERGKQHIDLFEKSIREWANGLGKDQITR